MFVTFEGIDGAGKSTQMDMLAEWLSQGAGGPFVYLAKCPGGTSFGAELRKILMDNPVSEDSPLAELLLFNADMAHFIDTDVQSCRAQHDILLSDRYFDSTLVYQSEKNDSALVWRCVQTLLKGKPWAVPDLTFVLDIDPAEASKRLFVRGVSEKNNRFDHLDIEVKVRMRDRFKKLKNKWPDRIHIIDANRDNYSVFEDVWKIFEYHCDLDEIKRRQQEWMSLQQQEDSRIPCGY